MKWLHRPTTSLNDQVASALFERSPDAILLLSEGRFIACNKAAEIIYARPRSEILGHNPQTFSPPTQGDFAPDPRRRPADGCPCHGTGAAGPA